MSFSEGKDSYEDQIANLKQQINELISEVRNLMNEKYDRLLRDEQDGEYYNNNNDLQQQQQEEEEEIQQQEQQQQQQQRYEYQSPYKSINTPSTPQYLERQRIQETLDSQTRQWEQEKKEMQQQYQSLHAHNIQLESEIQTLRESNESSQKELLNIHIEHDKEFKKMKESNDHVIKMMKTAYSGQLNEKNTNNNNNMIKELTDGLTKLELENNEMKNSRIKLLSELFEKNEEINQLRLDLESVRLSSQKMTEVFISTPLREQQTPQKRQQSEEDEDKQPIKFNLPEELLTNPNNNNNNNNNEQQIDQLNQQLNELREQLEKKDRLIQSFEEENNELQEVNDMLSVEVDKLNLLVPSTNNDSSNNNNTNNNNNIDEKIRICVQKKEEEIDKLNNDKLQMEKEIKYLGNKINNQMIDFKEMSASYKQQLLDLSARYEVNVQQLASNELQYTELYNSLETAIINTKSKMLQQFEDQQEKLSMEIRDEYNQNIKILKSEILQLQVKLLAPPTPTQHWIDKYNTLKDDYDDMMDKLEEYQFRITLLNQDNANLNTKLKRFRVEPDYIDESEVIVISSDDEDVDYTPKPTAEVEEEFDYSKIEIKKNPYEKEDEEEQAKDDGSNNNNNSLNDISRITGDSFNNSKERSSLNLNDLDNTLNSNNTTYYSLNNSNNISTTGNNTSNNINNTSQQAISNNLHIISQISELEKSFHNATRLDNDNEDEDYDE
ncbi:Formin 2 domain-containing protein [Heterostelium album PN500]|uniref:Formin 2 domain-containing protein n=1 Tax=Heterostelium pallidum (strain ATCC 26659 / Pp 5 / PN500) TaxID=670386 RepID=D3B8I9_HETP5|nr:Formin 2 domain-containing protein [Heterostelium album PN500]EFA82357.1 Formin 2 domain-containing protein [Heterostelium album PN500]|eukprot:XP_020434474.1 Formin 2 domain-containing protein [Heterostelium album PN500]